MSYASPIESQLNELAKIHTGDHVYLPYEASGEFQGVAFQRASWRGEMRVDS